MRRSLLLALATAAAVALTLALLASGTQHGIRSVASRARRVAVDRPRPVLQRRTLPAADRLPGAVVSVAANPAIIGVPPSFLGVSTEYWAMPMFDRHVALFERVLTLLRVHGTGPFVLRIGGDSTDHALFDVNVRRRPKAVLELTPAWFQRASVLVRDISARVILDLNLVTDLPRMAARWAHAAQTELPRGSIVAYEIGNEPDLYDPGYWSEIFSPLERVLDIRLLPVEPSAEAYARLYRSYARVLSRFAPGVPLAAPVLAYPGAHLNWIATLLAGPHPGLGIVSAHEYPYSACATRLSPSWPTIGRILSEHATAGIARLLRPAIVLARRAGLPFRLSELNSVTCGGVAGVSNTFATALWAPDALFELVRAGVDAVNVHVRPFTVNAAFVPTATGIVARPLLYGLILFTRALGPSPQLVDARVRVGPAAHLKVWVVRVGGDALHVLLDNKGDRPVRAELQLPATGTATVQRLLAPSATARTGVTLDGQHLGPDFDWLGRRVSETITPGPAGYLVGVPATSAALVEVHLAPAVKC